MAGIVGTTSGKRRTSFVVRAAPSRSDEDGSGRRGWCGGCLGTVHGSGSIRLGMPQSRRGGGEAR